MTPTKPNFEIFRVSLTTRNTTSIFILKHAHRGFVPLVRPERQSESEPKGLR